MNNLFVLLAIQTLVSVLLIVWVRLKVMRSLDDGDSIARVRREIGALIVELDGSADRNITVLEDRLRELKDCITEADKRIVMLSNERARASPTHSSPIPHAYRPGTPMPQALPESIQVPERVTPSPLEVIQPSDQAAQPSDQAARPSDQAARPSDQVVRPSTQAARSSDQAARPSTKAARSSDQATRSSTEATRSSAEASRPTMPALQTQTPSVPFIRFSEKPVVFDDSFSERVARLHKRGFSSDIIAAKLKATIAEVDLAIAAGGTPMEGRGAD
jgi:hypothetical protein